MSSRQFGGDLLRRIGEAWSQDEDMAAPIPECRWGDEVANVSEPILDALKVNTEASGDDFKEAQEEFIRNLINIGVSPASLVCDTAACPDQLPAVADRHHSPAGASRSRTR